MVGDGRASSAVRVSMSDETSEEELDEALRRWARVLKR
jgi:cysteine sulfinate desulfinase/cysteine desulfurase-like protein